MSYLILVRHGQSVWNLENRFTGWVDIDLNENGKTQAKKAGELIKEQKLNIDQYYSSFQLRAKNTLKICLLYTSPSPRDLSTSRMPSSA